MPTYYLTDWSDDYLIGIEKIDNQHKEFFRIAHQFFTECLADEGEEYLQDTLNFLGNYARKHFEGEEAFMKEIEYPRLEEHKRLHINFLNRYSELIVEFKEYGRTEKMVNKVLTVVMDWLKDHIAKADGSFAKHAKIHS
jgi:hemerythrin-like metal-binding protein